MNTSSQFDLLNALAEKYGDHEAVQAVRAADAMRSSTAMKVLVAGEDPSKRGWLANFLKEQFSTAKIAESALPSMTPSGAIQFRTENSGNDVLILAMSCEALGRATEVAAATVLREAGVPVALFSCADLDRIAADEVTDLKLYANSRLAKLSPLGEDAVVFWGNSDPSSVADALRTVASGLSEYRDAGHQVRLSNAASLIRDTIEGVRTDRQRALQHCEQERNSLSQRQDAELEESSIRLLGFRNDLTMCRELARGKTRQFADEVALEIPAGIDSLEFPEGNALDEAGEESDALRKAAYERIVTGVAAKASARYDRWLALEATPILARLCEVGGQSSVEGTMERVLMPLRAVTVVSSDHSDPASSFEPKGPSRAPILLIIGGALLGGAFFATLPLRILLGLLGAAGVGFFANETLGTKQESTPSFRDAVASLLQARARRNLAEAIERAFESAIDAAREEVRAQMSDPSANAAGEAELLEKQRQALASEVEAADSDLRTLAEIGSA